MGKNTVGAVWLDQNKTSRLTSISTGEMLQMQML